MSCQLCETAKLVDHLKTRLGIDFGDTTTDGLFTLADVQCLGACGEAGLLPAAPVVEGAQPLLLDEPVDALAAGAAEDPLGPPDRLADGLNACNGFGNGRFANFGIIFGVAISKSKLILP